MGVDGDALRIVDVVYNQIAVGACNDSNIVAHTSGTALHIGKHAICQHKTDGICQIHACVALHTLALNVDDVGRKEHADKVERIDTKVEQGSSAKVGTHDARLIAHAVAKRGSNHAWGADSPATDEITHHLNDWLIACPYGFGKKDLALMCQFDDFF